MRDATLPIALLLLAHAFVLAAAPPRVIAQALALVLGGAGAAMLLGVGPAAIEFAFAGCWLSIIANVVALNFRRHVTPTLLFALALVAGIAAGALASAAGDRQALLVAAPALLAIIPARVIIARGLEIGLRIASGWLAAIALLGSVLPLVPTPGYRKDHMQ